MPDKRRLKYLAGPLFVLLILSVTLLALDAAGRTARHFRPDHTVYTVERPEDAFALWQSLNLRGRTALYFDRHFNLDNSFHQSLNIRFATIGRDLPPADSRNYLSLALYHNIFRMVYHVVPDRAWPEVRDKLSGYPFISFNGKRFRLTIEGVPIIVTRLGDLPGISEKVVIYVNSEHQEDYDKTRLNWLMQAGEIADVVVIKKSNG